MTQMDTPSTPDQDKIKSSSPTASGVVVLGPGRSGTSALSRAFVRAGFWAGGEGEVLGAGHGNPLGHYEPLPVLRLNEELLAELGCSWWAGVPDPELQFRQRGRMAPRIEVVLETMRGAAAGAPVLVKDPRINSLLPLWAPALEKRLHPVLAVRDPVEIGFSHGERDGTSPAHAIATWEVQMTMLLDWLDERVVTVAPYGQLVARPQLAGEVVARVAAKLEPSLATVVDPAAAASALDPQLRNHASSEADRAESLTRRQAELWEFLQSLPLGDVELHVPASLRTPGEAALAAVAREGERVALATEHGKVVGRLEEATATIARLERARAEAAARLADVEARHTAEAEAIFSSASWRLTAPLRRLRRLRQRT
jgi:hypothetical protein